MDETAFDGYGPDEFVGGPPHELFDRDRALAPVRWVERPVGGGYWSVTAYNLVKEVLGDQPRFSSWRGGINMEDPSERSLAVQRQMMITMDPPEHTAHRLTVNRRFVPRSIEQWRERIAAIASDVIDETVAGGGAGRACDFVESVAAEIPLIVIAELLGVTAEHRDRFHAWSDAVANSQDPEYVASSADVVKAMKDMTAYGLDRLAERRAEPRDDLLTAISRAEVHGEPLDEAHQGQWFFLLLAAGNETTRNALSGSLIAFDQFPDQRRLLAQRPELLDSAVEEVLRWFSPVHYFRRTATADTTLGGERIAEGEKVVVWLTAANRDPAVFADPHRFDITRDPNPHLAFGHGTHFCLGAHLARLEIRLSLPLLFERLPGLELAGLPDFARNNFLRAVKRLPVRWAA
ncbi:MAG: cytochrome P450 [Acidimicrobiales bacterium]